MADKTFTEHVQGWLAPGVILAVIATLSSCNKERLDKIDANIDRVEKRIVELSTDWGQRLNNMDSRITTGNGRLDQVLQAQSTAATTNGRIEAELAHMKARLESVAKKLEIADASPYGAQTPTANGFRNSPGQREEPSFASTGTTTAVKEFIRGQGRPSIRVSQDVSVGATLPQNVQVYDLPTRTNGASTFAVVNDKPVLVSPERKVIYVLE